MKTFLWGGGVPLESGFEISWLKTSHTMCFDIMEMHQNGFMIESRSNTLCWTDWSLYHNVPSIELFLFLRLGFHTEHCMMKSEAAKWRRRVKKRFYTTPIFECNFQTKTKVIYYYDQFTLYLSNNVIIGAFSFSILI